MYYNRSMLSFALDSQLTKQLITLKEKVDEKFELLKGTDPNELRAIHRYARISMIGASTRIENAVLTDSEIDWMDSIIEKDAKRTAFDTQRRQIENKLSKDKQRSIEEVAGCRTMLHLVYEQTKDFWPMTEMKICGLHAELLRFYSKPGIIKGEYKKSPNSVVEKNHNTDKTRTIFKTADPGIVTQTAMADLVKWYNEVRPEEPWTLPVACEFVYRFLAIHPFQDGNGRIGRGLFLLSLLQSTDEKLSVVSRHLAIDRHIERHKEDYYMVLNQCSGGTFSPERRQYQIQFFLKFMIKILSDSLDDIQFYKEKHENYRKLSESALAVLKCFRERPEIQLKPKDIIAATNLPRRTVSRVLSDLSEKQFLQKYGQRAGVRYQLVF